jgi:ATP-dependent Clp protease ATP-binding subunit ClpC
MDPQSYLDNLSNNLKNTIAKSISLAASLGETKVKPAHILLVMSRQKGTVGSELVAKLDINKKTIEQVVPAAKNSEELKELPELNQKSKKALEKAMLLAHEYEHSYIGTEHLLSGLVHCEDKDISEILQKNNLDIEQIDQQVEIILSGTSRFPDLDNISGTLDQIKNMAKNAGNSSKNLPNQSTGGHMKPKLFSQPKQKGAKSSSNESPIDMFTTKLTDKERQGNIDPVIGREKEITRLTHILCRRNKNNPVLVGEPGVGKTAIVEGLAKRVVNGEVPDLLKRKEIFSLDLTLLISGTIYRGEFESRLNKIIDKFSNQEDYLLFIDELHNIIGTGSNQGTMDAANILKPALARGELHCIGATTIDEYNQYITDDPALERRFQAVDVDEPSIDEAKTILQGVKNNYDKFHNVEITKEAIESAVELSSKYIHDNFLPDKALDLLDEASSSVRVKQGESELDKKKRELKDLQGDYIVKKERAIEKENFDKALKWKQALGKVNKKINNLEEKLINKKRQEKKDKVNKKNVADVLARQLSVDSELLLQNDWEQLDRLSQELKQEVKGQNHVIDKIIESLQKSYLGIHDQDQPLSSFLFVGPSGVGKTETARNLAKKLYYDEDALVKVDMTEFSEAHGVSKLLGSPAGYVGHEERNRFLEQVKKKPYSVVLLDEFDKAHPDVQKLLMQILDEGKLTESNGKEVSFRHTIIILTTNVGSEMYQSHSIGFGESEAEEDKREQIIKNKLKNTFSSALIGRIKELCLFSPLEDTDIEQIVSKHITEMAEKVENEHEIELDATNEAISALADEYYDPDTGVRHLEQVVDDIVQELLIEKIRDEQNQNEFKLRKRGDSYKLS